MTLVSDLNRVAGTSGLAAQGAANAWAGTSGLGLLGALNFKAGNSLAHWRGLRGVLNQLANTEALDLDIDGAAHFLFNVTLVLPSAVRATVDVGDPIIKTAGNITIPAQTVEAFTVVPSPTVTGGTSITVTAVAVAALSFVGSPTVKAGAVTFVASALANNGQTAISGFTTPITFTIPGSAAANDLAIVTISTNSPSDTMSSIPSGWTAMANTPTDQATTSRCYQFYKVLSAGDISASTMPFALSSNNRNCGIMDVFRGADLVNPIHQQAVATANASTTQACPAVTTTVDNCLIYNVWCGRNASGVATSTIAVPGTHTADAYAGTAYGSGAQCELRGGHKTVSAAAGSFGTYTGTYSTSANGSFWSVAIKPA